MLPILHGQSVQDITLREKLRDEYFLRESHQILVKGDIAAVEEWIKRQGGIVKYTAGEWSAIGIPGDKLEELSKMKEVEKIYFRDYPGVLLNDRVIQNANVAGLLNSWQYDSSLTGKGVIVGFVDAGIDFTHEDFIDEDGKTRILYFWDQKPPADSSLIYEDYGYGRLITADSLNYWLQTDSVFPLDPDNLYGHGSNVAGTAAGNGRALAEQVEQGLLPADFHGIAGESKIVMVATNLSAENWLATVADGVDFILNIADSLDMPVVLNLSVGTYLGSHDALDAVGSIINQWFDDSHTGRMLVCAAGNSGQYRYHLGYSSDGDTSLAFFGLHDGLSGPGKGAFFEMWIDSAMAEQFMISAEVTSLIDYSPIATGGFSLLKDNIDTIITDTLMSDTVAAGIVSSFAEYRGDQIRLQVKVDSVFGNNSALAFQTLGQGRVDVWSGAWLGTSDILGPEQLPGMPANLIDKYKAPDSLMQVVSSFSCAPNVLTVASYRNRVTYIDVNGNPVNYDGQTGEIAPSSSRGPSRDGRFKPDIAASGEVVLSTGAYNVVETALAINPPKVALGGRHLRNRGTSMASPVVAGVAALYLQHCPGELPSQIRQHITGTAIPDIFTGSIPNYRWGYGKVNGLAALNSSLFPVEISASPGSECEPGQVLLATEELFGSYNWSSGDTTAQICAWPGIYTVTVSDENGCWSISDPFEVIVDDVSTEKRPGTVLFPNPNNGEFILNGIMPGMQISIINILGEAVGFEKYVEGNQLRIVLNQVVPGIYFLIAGKTINMKIIVK